MNQRRPLHKASLRSYARACLAAILLLLACLPAAAADGRRSHRTALPNGSDPFAADDAELDAAASRTLKEIDESRPTTSPAPTFRSMQAVTTATGTSVRGAQASWRRVEDLLPVIEPILRQVGIPVQLAAVVLVESGGDSMALSPKGARGLWQLMPDTARRYGLTVSAKMDQRVDILQSTRAAAEYLRDLYAEFHNWPLALAAYNAGDQAVQRAMARTGGDAFPTAARALPTETQNYVPAVFNAVAMLGGSTQMTPMD